MAQPSWSTLFLVPEKVPPEGPEGGAPLENGQAEWRLVATATEGVAVHTLWLSTNGAVVWHLDKGQGASSTGTALSVRNARFQVCAVRPAAGSGPAEPELVLLGVTEDGKSGAWRRPAVDASAGSEPLVVVELAETPGVTPAAANGAVWIDSHGYESTDGTRQGAQLSHLDGRVFLTITRRVALASGGFFSWFLGRPKSSNETPVVELAGVLPGTVGCVRWLDRSRLCVFGSETNAVYFYNIAGVAPLPDGTFVLAEDTLTREAVLAELVGMRSILDVGRVDEAGRCLFLCAITPNTGRRKASPEGGGAVDDSYACDRWQTIDLVIAQETPGGPVRVWNTRVADAATLPYRTALGQLGAPSAARIMAGALSTGITASPSPVPGVAIVCSTGTFTRASEAALAPTNRRITRSMRAAMMRTHEKMPEGRAWFAYMYDQVTSTQTNGPKRPREENTEEDMDDTEEATPKPRRINRELPGTDGVRSNTRQLALELNAMSYARYGWTVPGLVLDGQTSTPPALLHAVHGNEFYPRTPLEVALACGYIDGSLVNPTEADHPLRLARSWLVKDYVEVARLSSVRQLVSPWHSRAGGKVVVAGTTAANADVFAFGNSRFAYTCAKGALAVIDTAAQDERSIPHSMNYAGSPLVIPESNFVYCNLALLTHHGSADRRDPATLGATDAPSSVPLASSPDDWLVWAFVSARGSLFYCRLCCIDGAVHLLEKWVEVSGLGLTGSSYQFNATAEGMALVNGGRYFYVPYTDGSNGPAPAVRTATLEAPRACLSVGSRSLCLEYSNDGPCAVHDGVNEKSYTVFREHPLREVLGASIHDGRIVVVGVSAEKPPELQLLAYVRSGTQYVEESCFRVPYELVKRVDGQLPRTIACICGVWTSLWVTETGTLVFQTAEPSKSSWTRWGGSDVDVPSAPFKSFVPHPRLIDPWWSWTRVNHNDFFCARGVDTSFELQWLFAAGTLPMAYCAVEHHDSVSDGILLTPQDDGDIIVDATQLVLDKSAHTKTNGGATTPVKWAVWGLSTAVLLFTTSKTEYAGILVLSVSASLVNGAMTKLSGRSSSTSTLLESTFYGARDIGFLLALPYVWRATTGVDDVQNMSKHLPLQEVSKRVLQTDAIKFLCTWLKQCFDASSLVAVTMPDVTRNYNTAAGFQPPAALGTKEFLVVAETIGDLSLLNYAVRLLSTTVIVNKAWRYLEVVVGSATMPWWLKDVYRANGVDPLRITELKSRTLAQHAAKNWDWRYIDQFEFLDETSLTGFAAFVRDVSKDTEPLVPRSSVPWELALPSDASVGGPEMMRKVKDGPKYRTAAALNGPIQQGAIDCEGLAKAVAFNEERMPIQEDAIDLTELLNNGGNFRMNGADTKALLLGPYVLMAGPLTRTGDNSNAGCGVAVVRSGAVVSDNVTECGWYYRDSTHVIDRWLLPDCVLNENFVLTTFKALSPTDALLVFSRWKSLAASAHIPAKVTKAGDATGTWNVACVLVLTVVAPDRATLTSLRTVPSLRQVKSYQYAMAAATPASGMVIRTNKTEAPKVRLAAWAQEGLLESRRATVKSGDPLRTLRSVDPGNPYSNPGMPPLLTASAVWTPAYTLSDTPKSYGASFDFENEKEGGVKQVARSEFVPRGKLPVEHSKITAYSVLRSGAVVLAHIAVPVAAIAVWWYGAPLVWMLASSGVGGTAITNVAYRSVKFSARGLHSLYKMRAKRLDRDAEEQRKELLKNGFTMEVLGASQAACAEHRQFVLVRQTYPDKEVELELREYNVQLNSLERVYKCDAALGTSLGAVLKDTTRNIQVVMVHRHSALSIVIQVASHCDVFNVYLDTKPLHSVSNARLATRGTIPGNEYAVLMSVDIGDQYTAVGYWPRTTAHPSKPTAAKLALLPWTYPVFEPNNNPLRLVQLDAGDAAAEHKPVFLGMHVDDVSNEVRAVMRLPSRIVLRVWATRTLETRDVFERRVTSGALMGLVEGEMARYVQRASIGPVTRRVTNRWFLVFSNTVLQAVDSAGYNSAVTVNGAPAVAADPGAPCDIVPLLSDGKDADIGGLTTPEQAQQLAENEVAAAAAARQKEIDKAAKEAENAQKTTDNADAASQKRAEALKTKLRALRKTEFERLGKMDGLWNTARLSRTNVSRMKIGQTNKDLILTQVDASLSDAKTSYDEYDTTLKGLKATLDQAGDMDVNTYDNTEDALMKLRNSFNASLRNVKWWESNAKLDKEQLVLEAKEFEKANVATQKRAAACEIKLRALRRKEMDRLDKLEGWLQSANGLRLEVSEMSIIAKAARDNALKEIDASISSMKSAFEDYKKALDGLKENLDQPGDLDFNTYNDTEDALMTLRFEFKASLRKVAWQKSNAELNKTQLKLAAQQFASAQKLISEVNRQWTVAHAQLRRMSNDVTEFSIKNESTKKEIGECVKSEITRARAHNMPSRLDDCLNDMKRAIEEYSKVVDKVKTSRDTALLETRADTIEPIKASVAGELIQAQQYIHAFNDASDRVSQVEQELKLLNTANADVAAANKKAAADAAQQATRETKLHTLHRTESAKLDKMNGMRRDALTLRNTVRKLKIPAVDKRRVLGAMDVSLEKMDSCYSKYEAILVGVKERMDQSFVMDLKTYNETQDNLMQLRNEFNDSLRDVEWWGSKADFKMDDLNLAAKEYVNVRKGVAACNKLWTDAFTQLRRITNIGAAFTIEIALLKADIDRCANFEETRARVQNLPKRLDDCLQDMKRATDEYRKVVDKVNTSRDAALLETSAKSVDKFGASISGELIQAQTFVQGFNDANDRVSRIRDELDSAKKVIADLIALKKSQADTNNKVRTRNTATEDASRLETHLNELKAAKLRVQNGQEPKEPTAIEVVENEITRTTHARNAKMRQTQSTTETIQVFSMKQATLGAGRPVGNTQPPATGPIVRPAGPAGAAGRPPPPPPTQAVRPPAAAAGRPPPPPPTQAVRPPDVQPPIMPAADVRARPAPASAPPPSDAEDFFNFKV